MNLLTDHLAQWVEVDGIRYPVYTDFRNWIRFEQLMTDHSMALPERIAGALELCFVKTVPKTLDAALKAAASFFTMPQQRPGEAEGTAEIGSTGSVKRIYHFTYDAPYIYAAFMAQYQIDLQCAQLHWWQFCALFQSLSDEQKISKIMEIRAADLSKIRDKEQKAYYRKMKAYYRLPDMRSEQEKDADIARDLENLF